MSNRKVVIAGCGNVARHAHCPAWSRIPGFEIAGLADPDQGAVQRLVEKLGVSAPGFRSLEEALARVKPDVVDICSPGFLHVEHATAALEAGCDVLIEKPPVHSVAEATGLCRLAERRQRKIGALLNYRNRDLVLGLKQAADSGRLGQIVKINVTHHGPFIFGDAPWLWDERRSKYLLWEFGIHFLDIMVMLLGQPESIVYVDAERSPELGHTTDLEVKVKFRSGATGRLEITADTTRHSSAMTRIEAYGTAQDAFVRWFPPSLRFQASVASPFSFLLDELKAVSFVGWKILRGEYTAHRNVSHDRTIAAFAEWVRGGAEYPMPLRSVISTIQLLTEIEAKVPSYREGPAGSPGEAMVELSRGAA
jgi:predicted dehydrogenase